MFIDKKEQKNSADSGTGATFRVSMLAVAWKPTGRACEKLGKEASAHLRGAENMQVLMLCWPLAWHNKSDMETWRVSTVGHSGLHGPENVSLCETPEKFFGIRKHN